MATKKADALGLAIAKAMDLDVDAVRKIVLTCEVGEVDKVEVTYTLPEVEAGEIVSVIRGYELTDVT